MGSLARKLRRRSVRKRAHHPVQDDCLFWADAAGMPAPPPAAHAPTCLFEGGKSIDECLVCQLSSVYAKMVWETGDPQIVHLDNLRADLLVTDDPSVGVTTYNGEPGAPEIFGRLRRGDESSLFILGPMIVEQCPYGDHAASPEESAEIQKQFFPGVELLPQPPNAKDRQRAIKALAKHGLHVGDLHAWWLDADDKPDKDGQAGPAHDLNCRLIGGTGGPETCFTCHLVDMAEAIFESGKAESVRNVPESYCVWMVPDADLDVVAEVRRIQDERMPEAMSPPDWRLQ